MYHYHAAHITHPQHNPGTASANKQQQGGVVKVIQLSRANNVSIMLTTFGEVKPADLRSMLLTGRGLTLDKLSILLQVVIWGVCEMCAWGEWGEGGLRGVNMHMY